MARLIFVKGEYYAALDEVSNLYCVFHTEHNKSLASFSDKDEADRDAADRNENNRIIKKSDVKVSSKTGYSG